jgi:hypothetical protein
MTPRRRLSPDQHQQLLTLFLTELRAARREAAAPPGTPARPSAAPRARPTDEAGEGEQGPASNIVAAEEPG